MLAFAHYAFSRFRLRRTAHCADTGYSALTRGSLSLRALRAGGPFAQLSREALVPGFTLCFALNSASFAFGDSLPRFSQSEKSFQATRFRYARNARSHWADGRIVRPLSQRFDAPQPPQSLRDSSPWPGAALVRGRLRRQLCAFSQARNAGLQGEYD